MRAKAGIAAVIALLSACSPDPSTPVESEAAGAEVASSVEGVHRVFTPESPVFVVAGDGTGKSLSFLALKDEIGNPYLVNGASIVDGDDFFSVEVDSRGRPTRFATRDAVVELSSYTETSVIIETRRLDQAESRFEEVSFDAEELEALRASPLDLTLIEKQTGDDLGVRLDAFRADVSTTVASLYDMSDAVQCRKALSELAESRSLSGAIVRGIAAGIECSGQVAQQVLNDPALVEAIQGMASTVGCAGGVVIGTAGAVSGLVPAVLLGLGLVVTECPDAVEAYLDMERRLRQEARLRSPFSPQHQGELRQDEMTEVTFLLSPQVGDDTLTDVRIDLTALGVPALLPLTRDRTSGTWRRTEMLRPPRGGPQVVPFVIEGRVTVVHPVYVKPADALRVSVTVSNEVAQPDEVLLVRAGVSGGVPPYRFKWFVSRGGTAEIQLPQAVDRGEFDDVLPLRTQYGVVVADASTHVEQSTNVMVELCGDRFCGPAENDQNCAADCAPEPDLEASSCDAACAYRASLGCAGDASICAIFCDVAHDIAEQQGACAPIAVQLEDCRYSAAALNLGCTASTEAIDESVCAAYASAFDACEAARDAPAR
jgi:hypothetical protein